MKILHIIPNLKKGGAERLVLDICRQLIQKQDIIVKLIVFSEKNEYSFLMKGVDVEVIPAIAIPSLSGKSIVEVKQLQAYVDAFQPDVIHSHLFETEMVLAHISLPVKTKRIIHFHDTMPQFRNLDFKTLFNKSSLTNFFEKRIVLKGYQKNTLSICISINIKDYSETVLPKSIESVLLYNAIDLERFNNDHYDNNTFNEIAITGSLVDKKGHDLAVETIKELVNRNIKIHLHILGDGPNKNRLEGLIDELNLQSNITMHGLVDHPEDFLKNCKIYLHTASHEPFGLVLIEAMACGLPVVCTDGRGNRDLIQEGENGFMVGERDPKLLADKIELLLKNDILRQEMSEKARKFAQGFGMEKYVESLILLYQKT
jgi:glycosyltransferase involved in cell wall biosynthesis